MALSTSCCEEALNKLGGAKDLERELIRRDFLYANQPSLGDLAIFSFLTMGPPHCLAPAKYSCFGTHWKNDEKWTRLKRMFHGVNSSALLRPYLTYRKGQWAKYSEDDDVIVT